MNHIVLRGKQSRRLMEIRYQINLGTNISHILEIEVVSNEPISKQEAETIRREIKNRVWNAVWHLNIIWNNAYIPVAITWTMNNATSTLCCGNTLHRSYNWPSCPTNVEPSV
mmetsp:Transcript_15427/g.21175  ORF Transcript_15427/g.21175 Transcript_15427/m.21175 type:complete len:112 (-) Transcript_15427:255-590(-)